MKKVEASKWAKLISEDEEVITNGTTISQIMSNFLKIGKKDVCKKWDKIEKKYIEINKLI